MYYKDNFFIIVRLNKLSNISTHPIKATIPELRHKALFLTQMYEYHLPNLSISKLLIPTYKAPKGATDLEENLSAQSANPFHQATNNFLPLLL